MAKKKARIEPVVEGADARAAESYGYAAAFAGKPLDSNPYNGECKEAWINGWERCARAMNWRGV